MPYDQLVEGIVTGRQPQAGRELRRVLRGDEQDLRRRTRRQSYADRPTMPLFLGPRQASARPEERAIGFAYTFLGIRIQCAQCHKHPFDQWSKADFDDFKQLLRAACSFAGSAPAATTRPQEEYKQIVKDLGLEDRYDSAATTTFAGNYWRMLEEGKTIPFPEVVVNQPRATPPRANNNRRNQPQPQATARVLGGETFDLTKFDDARQPLMDWLRSKDNPYFAKAFVNRVWANYFNVGIVEPPDDLSLANPPSNRPLLDYLAQGFIEHGFDMKWVHREICNSRTYQLSWQPNETNAKDERNFARSGAAAAAGRSGRRCAGNARSPRTRRRPRYLTDIEGPGDRRRRAPAPARTRATTPATRALPCRSSAAAFAKATATATARWKPACCRPSICRTTARCCTAIDGGKDSWIEQISKQAAEQAHRRQRRREARRQVARSPA